MFVQAAFGSWDLSEIGLNYGFQNSARPALRASLHRCATSASKVANSADCLRQGTRICLRRHGISFPPVLGPRCVTIVTKFPAIGTEPQHGPYIFRSGWHKVLTWGRSSGTTPTRRSYYGHQDDR